MMGAYEVNLKMKRRTDDFDTVVKFMGKMWPKGCYQPANEQKTYNLAQVKSLPRENDFFIYQDEKVFHQIDEDGLTDELATKVVHIVFESQGITYFVDDEDTPLDSMMKGLEPVLLKERTS